MRGSGGFAGLIDVSRSNTKLRARGWRTAAPLCRAGNGGASTELNAASRSWPSSPHLLLEHLLDLTDFFLDLAGLVLGLAFSLQVRVVRDLADLFFDFAFHFMKGALDLILGTRSHRFSPYR